MKKQVFLFTALLCFVAAAAQRPLNSVLSNLTTQPCPYDGTSTVNWPAQWQVYQTLDDTWDGPVDSTRCISLEAVNNRARLFTDDIDTDRSVFIRTDEFTLGGFVENINDVYLAQTSLLFSDGLFFNSTTDCPGGLCTGLVVQTSIYNETADERVIRTYSESIDGDNQFYTMESCIPIERYEDQRFESFVIKLNFTNPPIPMSPGYVDLNFAGLEYFFPPNTFDTLAFAESDFNGQVYERNLRTMTDGDPFINTYLGLYNRPTFPSPSDVAYIEASLPESITAPQTLNLVIDEMSSLFLQPFTQMRGALVAGSDSLRHELNVINDGNDWCFPDVIELVFNGNGNFEYRSGHIDFGGTTSCMMFRNGSELRVHDGATFHYGDNGEGILGIHYGGKIVLGKQSELFINNRVVLWNDPAALSPEEAIVELRPGQRLVFGAHSRIDPKAWGSLFTVYMNGGVLDDSQLSPESRALIKRIYPEQPESLSENVNIFPNPVKETLQWSYIATAEEQLHWQWHNAAGQVLQQGYTTAQKGHNTLQQPCLLPAGVYYLKVRSQTGQVTVPFVKGH